MSKAKKILTNGRVIILLICILLAILAINPQPWADGVTIKSAAKNSSAVLAGIENPKANSQPLSKERVLSINGKDIHSVADYYDIVSTFTINQTVTLKTTKKTYALQIKPLIKNILLNETETKTITEEINGTNVTRVVTVPKIRHEIVGPADIGLTVGEAPTNNLRKGLDLQGGTRVILKPAEHVDDTTLALLIDSLTQRLNVFGLSDIVVTTVSGGVGEDALILIEIAGASPQEVTDLVQQQGKFEAKVANTTVFRGGSNDITYVCRTAECSGLDPNRGCGLISSNAWSCGFRFSIALSPVAAQRQADATRGLSLAGTGTDRYLSEPLNLYLDDELVRSLNIGASLRGQAVTDIQISGSGSGVSQQDALNNMFTEMKTLQTVLITGSLPVKLDLVKVDTISPVLGDAFIANALLVGLFSALAVTVILTAVYRKIRIIIPIILTAVFEVLITLGIASLIHWNLDLASIAGIIIAIGTGVNDQIIITDEAFKKEDKGPVSWKERIKNAFFVIMAGFFTDVVAMLMLWFFGAGLLKGFAITTILALIVGAFITRPAYAAIVNYLVED